MTSEDLQYFGVLEILYKENKPLSGKEFGDISTKRNVAKFIPSDMFEKKFVSNEAYALENGRGIEMKTMITEIGKSKYLILKTQIKKEAQQTNILVWTLIMSIIAAIAAILGIVIPILTK